MEGEFDDDNLVPQPNHVLWQDCPYVPFDKLVSEDSQARLCVCRPIDPVQETTHYDGVERFAILVVSKEHGALVREAAPPPR